MSEESARLFDLVLINHEYDLAVVRVKEVAACVDTMVFVQPAFTFSDNMSLSAGRPPLQSYVSLPNVHVRAVAADGAAAACNGMDATRRAWCRQSFARNALLEEFDRRGGRDEDIAIISDADEVPDAKALRALRTAAGISSPTRSNDSWVLSSTHHFKYTVACEAPSPWTKGPIAMSGALLRSLGAQAARAPAEPYCAPVGYRATCQRGRRRGERVWNGASWHLSSMSSGLAGHLRKMRSNSAAIAGDRQSLLDPAVVSARMEHCMDHLGRDGVVVPPRTGTSTAAASSPSSVSTFLRPTKWGRGSVAPPRYPDVPHTVASALTGQTHGGGALAHLWRPDAWRHAKSLWEATDLGALLAMPQRQCDQTCTWKAQDHRVPKQMRCTSQLS